MAKIFIENKEFEADQNKNLLEVCLSLGFDLPYFCWHPALGSVGACRQCAVVKFKDESDKKGRLVMACMEPVQNNSRISIVHEEAVEFRAHIIEWLMTNHPHDCPVCDEGGECHLQDMTVMTGHTYRRHRYKKRTYKNQYLGPFINHEMNRCIQCYRCVRFYRDYADGRDLDAFAAHDHVYFGRHDDGVLENEFSGNLVEVCPTGVFTDKTLKKHYTRKWDLTNAPSICHHCSLGCNIIASERYGKLRRILSRYNSKVNGYFLCDRGRFGYEFVNHPKRIKQPKINLNGKQVITERASILSELKNVFISSKKVIGIGSPRASLESNFALMKLVGKENFYNGISKKDQKLSSLILEILLSGIARTPSLKETEEADAIFILGEDLTNTAPMLALSVRQAVKQPPKRMAENLNIPIWNDDAVRELVQDKKAPLFIAISGSIKLEDISSLTYHASMDDISRLGFAVANLINDKSPAVKNLNANEKTIAEDIASVLIKAEKPLIISGSSLKSETVIQAAANIAYALNASGKNAELSFVLPECNSMGLVMLGNEKSLDEAFQEVERENADTVIILENNLYGRKGENFVDKFFDKCKNVIALDYLENQTTLKSNFLLPSGSFAESDGTLVNNEGRAQRFFQVYPAPLEIKEGWKWLDDLMVASGKTETKWNNHEDCIKALQKEYPIFKDISDIAPPPGFRIAGQKIPRSPHRFSGRTAMHANINVSEPKPPDDNDSPLSFTMEGYKDEPPSSIIPFFWSPGWNSVQSINKYQIEVGGPLHGGDSGRRLIDAYPKPFPKGKELDRYFADIPEAFHKKDNEWLLVPLYQIFGSDSLSMLSPGIAERAGKSYLSLNPDDAIKLNLKKDDKIELIIREYQLKLPVKINIGLPEGVAGIPTGLPDLPYIEFPVWSKIKPVGI